MYIHIIISSDKQGDPVMRGISLCTMWGLIRVCHDTVTRTPRTLHEHDHDRHEDKLAHDESYYNLKQETEEVRHPTDGGAALQLSEYMV